MSGVLHFDTGVTLAGGGDFSDADLAESLRTAPHVVAADSGADRLLALGRRPLAVIGDMDSLSEVARATLPRDTLLTVAEQDSTDFEKCLTRIVAPLVLAIGFAGGRVDHALSVFNTLARYPRQRCVVLGRQDVMMLAPPLMDLDLEAGDRLSLFPMVPVFGRSRGLHWPIDGIAFAPGGAIGTSNRALGAVRLDFDAPGMLLILPRRRLPVLLSALTGAPRW